MVIFHSFFVCLPEGNYGGNPPWQSTATVVLQQLGALWLWHRNSAYQDEKHLKIGRVEDPPTRTHKLKTAQVVLSFSKPKTMVKKNTAGSNSRFGIVVFFLTLYNPRTTNTVIICYVVGETLVKRWGCPRWKRWIPWIPWATVSSATVSCESPRPSRGMCCWQLGPDVWGVSMGFP